MLTVGIVATSGIALLRVSSVIAIRRMTVSLAVCDGVVVVVRLGIVVLGLFVTIRRAGVDGDRLRRVPSGSVVRSGVVVVA